MRRYSRPALLRRALKHELLESRSLLAGMVGDSPWQNPLDANDLNCDGAVSPSDALVAINAINAGVASDLAGNSAPPQLYGDFQGADSDFLDADGDGLLAASDALAVINALNAHHGEPGNDVPDVDQPEAPGADAQVIDVTQGFARVRGVISDKDDVDVFQVAPTKTELNVALFSHGGGAVSVSIVDIAGNELDSAAIDADSHRPAKVNLDVEAGKTYYLVVSGAGGPYALGVLNFNADDFTPVPDSPLGKDIHGETGATATVLTLDRGQARVFSNIDAAGDADVFAVTAATSGKLVVEAHGELALKIDVSDAHGSLGTFSTSGRHALVINAAAGSTYFVAVMAANATDTGAYHLNVVNAPVHEPDDDHEPPGDHGRPTPLELFAKADADGNGSVSLAEFEEAVPGQHNRLADHVLASWDTDTSGTLSINEFVDGLSTLPPFVPHPPGHRPAEGPLGPED